MSRPPQFPINGEQDYFDIFIEEIRPFYDQRGIALTFEGYKETFDEYAQAQHNDYETMWRLSRDFHLWGEYFSELKALAEKHFLDYEAKEKQVFAEASIQADGSKVASGDRMANRSEEVIATRRGKNMLKAFQTMLDTKIESAFRAHHHCKATCNWLSAANAGPVSKCHR